MSPAAGPGPGPAGRSAASPPGLVAAAWGEVLAAGLGTEGGGRIMESTPARPCSWAAPPGLPPGPPLACCRLIESKSFRDPSDSTACETTPMFRQPEPATSLRKERQGTDAIHERLDLVHIQRPTPASTAAVSVLCRLRRRARGRGRGRAPVHSQHDSSDPDLRRCAARRQQPQPQPRAPPRDGAGRGELRVLAPRRQGLAPRGGEELLAPGVGRGQVDLHRPDCADDVGTARGQKANVSES